MTKIAVFASGNGTNALNLFKYFSKHPAIRFDKIYCNNPSAGIFEKCVKNGIDCKLFRKEEWLSGKIGLELKERQIDFIVLAGFLWLVPSDIISGFRNRIINIHPALLPKYGGKGMYGIKVHESVLANTEKESGITVHLVNEEYDKGEVLFQKTVSVSATDTPESLAEKIHHLEYEYYPSTVETYINNFKEPLSN